MVRCAARIAGHMGDGPSASAVAVSEQHIAQRAGGVDPPAGMPAGVRVDVANQSPWCSARPAARRRGYQKTPGLWPVPRPAAG